MDIMTETLVELDMSCPSLALMHSPNSFRLDALQSFYHFLPIFHSVDALRQVQSTSSILLGLEAVSQCLSLLRFDRSGDSFLMRFLVLRCVLSREMAVPRIFAKEQDRKRRFIGSTGECIL